MRMSDKPMRKILSRSGLLEAHQAHESEYSVWFKAVDGPSLGTITLDSKTGTVYFAPARLLYGMEYMQDIVYLMPRCFRNLE